MREDVTTVSELECYNVRKTHLFISGFENKKGTMSQKLWDECGESKKMNSSLKAQERNGPAKPWILAQ